MFILIDSQFLGHNFSQARSLPASIDTFKSESPIILFLYAEVCSSNLSRHGTDITLDFILFFFKSFDTSRAISTSEPEAKIETLGLFKLFCIS